jgi:hypothetical protein
VCAALVEVTRLRLSACRSRTITFRLHLKHMCRHCWQYHADESVSVTSETLLGFHIPCGIPGEAMFATLPY